jgi:hypothetical protein
MTGKKRGTAWDAVRDAYNLHEAQEAVTAISRTSGNTLWEIGNVALMLMVLALVAGLFYVFG